jgi:hypothetical protein
LASDIDPASRSLASHSAKNYRDQPTCYRSGDRHGDQFDPYHNDNVFQQIKERNVAQMIPST